jgi:hypothetical protein
MMLAQAKSLAMTPAEVGDRWEVADNMGGFIVRASPLPLSLAHRVRARVGMGRIGVTRRKRDCCAELSYCWKRGFSFL